MLKRIPKKLIMIVGPLAFAAVLVVFVLPMVFGDAVSINIGSANPAATVAPVTEPEPEEVHGIPFPLDERVVNLADPGGYRYLKVELVLELRADDIKLGDGGHGGGDALTAAQTELTSSLGTMLPKVQDTVTTVLTSKTVADVSTAAGKDAVKAELLEKLGPLFEEHEHPLLAIYFQQFLIQ
jgi:flagellar protein FliL